MNFDDKCINCFGKTGGETICMSCGFDQEIPDEYLSYLPPHTVLADRYEVGRILKITEENVFYKAWDRVLSNIVCIKEYFPEGSDMVSRVIGERNVNLLDPSKEEEWYSNKEEKLKNILISAKVSNDNIVHTVEVFEENGTVYHVMELLDGPSLYEYIGAVGKVSYEEMLDIVVPLCDAVDTLNRNGIVHGSINPGNIIITTDGDSKLIGVCSEGREKSAKTAFTSPEQDKGGSSDIRSDIYALAAVSYFVLVGEVPKKTGNESRDIKAVEAGLKAVSCPDFVINALKKALSYKTSDRFSSAEDFKDYIVGNNKLIDTGISKKKIVLSVVAVCLVAVLAIGGVAFGFFYDTVKNTYVPYEDASIRIWYEETGDKKADNQVVDKLKGIAKLYKKDTRGNSILAKLTTIDVKVEKKTKKEIETALKKKDKNGPDIYITASDIDSKYAASLDGVYEDIDEVIEKEKDKTASQFTLMENTLKGEKEIAFAYDMPLLYVNKNLYTGDDTPDDNASLDDLIGWQNSTNNWTYEMDFHTALMVNPEAVLYAAYSYGYKDGKSTKILNKLYNNVNADGITHVTGYNDLDGKLMIKYYIGLASEYSDVKSRSIDLEVMPLTGTDSSCIFFPETWSVNKNSPENQQRAALYMLYWIATNEGSGDDKDSPQVKLYKEDDGFRYIPLLGTAQKIVKEDSILSEETFSLSEDYSEYQFRVKKADSIKKLALKNVKTSTKKYKNTVNKKK